MSVAWFLPALLLLAPADGPRTIAFSGYTWQVKRGTGGPGPNHWSDAEESVRVDAAGRLHLAVRPVDGVWHCAEVSTRAFGHGTYRFRLASDVSALDPQVVLGLFVYRDDTHEIDVEWSRWGDPDRPPGNFAVQPSHRDGNRRSFALPELGQRSTHEFRWLPGRVDFLSHPGRERPETGAATWSCTTADVPQAGVDRLELNLWLFRGVPPTDARPVEVVIEAVEVEAPLRLEAEEAAEGPLRFRVSGGVPDLEVRLWRIHEKGKGEVVTTGRLDAKGEWRPTFDPTGVATDGPLRFRATATMADVELESDVLERTR